MEREWHVWGVVELNCWLGHVPYTQPTGRDAEECVDAHARCGITHLVWDLGRSVLTYHSDLPDATHLWDNAHLPGLRFQDRASLRMLGERCALRAAIAHAKPRGMVVYGRLCMNRHYAPGSPHRSAFADRHPEWCEQRKDGWVDVSRLCYAIPEYRRERVAILREAAQIGCDGLCLDFCRQPPAVRYHPSLVAGYRKRTGVDARKLSLSGDREAFLDWCRYRAESVTLLMRELKDALDPVRQRYGRPIPVRARVPDDGFEANLVAGFDVPAWCREGLVGEVALSELHWLDEYREWSARPYVKLGEETGVAVLAGSNCLPMQAGGWSGEVNPKGVNPVVLARRALRGYEQGARGISLYQSDTGVRWPGLAEFLPALSDPAELRRVAEDEALAEKHPITAENELFGVDNHSSPGPTFSFRASAGEEAAGA